MPIPLPRSVCIRVTRACNAMCDFCLAPQDGLQVPTDELISRFRWMADLGISSVTFCGGEPTVRSDLPQLLDAARHHQLRPKLTTNGIRISDELIEALRRTQTRVKVSVHGPREVHDNFLGVICFDKVGCNIDRLLAAGVFLSIQTIVTSKYAGAIEFAVQFCLERGIPKVSFVPFIPRGQGVATQAQYGMTGSEKARVKECAIQLRDQLRGQLDIRWLDFAARDYFVIETNGRLVIQRETDAADTVLGVALDTHGN